MFCCLFLASGVSCREIRFAGPEVPQQETNPAFRSAVASPFMVTWIVLETRKVSPPARSVKLRPNDAELAETFSPIAKGLMATPRPSTRSPGKKSARAFAYPRAPPSTPLSVLPNAPVHVCLLGPSPCELDARKPAAVPSQIYIQPNPQPTPHTDRLVRNGRQSGLHCMP
mgnify:CR=1 FL=1